jgi:hypothetical protein
MSVGEYEFDNGRCQCDPAQPHVWTCPERVMADNVTRIHPAPSITNPLHENPWAQMSDAEISMEITRANARIDAVEHTKRSLLRELERRSNLDK